MYVHKTENNHDFDLENVKILMTEKRKYPRKFVEASFSQFNNDSIKRTIEITDVYSTIIKRNIK